MNDKELLKAFEDYFADQGWTTEYASKMIGISKGTLFNWKNGGKISPTGRRAIKSLLLDVSPQHNDRLMQIINENWSRLTIDDKTDVIKLIMKRVEEQRSNVK